MGLGGPLSSVMMIAGAGMLPNTPAELGPSLSVNPDLVEAVDDFNNLAITQQFSGIIASAVGNISAPTLASLRSLAANTFPALTNAIPGGPGTALSVMAPGGTFTGGFTGLISTTANNIMGGGDLTRFSQIFNSTEGLGVQANQFINSNLNVGSLDNTFGSQSGGMDNLMTGGFNQVSQAFGAFGGDLTKLGDLIDMKDLHNLGSPAALIKQLANLGGLVPSVVNALKEVGLSSGDISNLISGNLAGLTDSANKALYDKMTKITGDELVQVTTILGVTTPNINSMADLLNPVKILPNSFTTLTMPTPNGLRGIYTSSDGSVNSTLEGFLSTKNQSTSSINPDLINRTRGSVKLSTSESYRTG